MDRDVTVLPDTLSSLAAELIGIGQIKISFAPSQTSAGQILHAIGEAGLGVVDVVTKEADLEKIFVRLTQSDNRAENLRIAK